MPSTAESLTLYVGRGFNNLNQDDALRLDDERQVRRQIGQLCSAPLNSGSRPEQCVLTRPRSQHLLLVLLC